MARFQLSLNLNDLIHVRELPADDFTTTVLEDLKVSFDGFRENECACPG